MVNIAKSRWLPTKQTFRPPARYWVFGYKPKLIFRAVGSFFAPALCILLSTGGFFLRWPGFARNYSANSTIAFLLPLRGRRYFPTLGRAFYIIIRRTVIGGRLFRFAKIETRAHSPDANLQGVTYRPLRMARNEYRRLHIR